MTGALGAVAAVASTPSMGVTISPDTAEGAYRGASTSPVGITTSAVVAVVSGGLAPFSYQWSQVGTSAYTWTIGSDTASSTTFTAGSVGGGATAVATFKITVTDAAGVVGTATVQAIADNLSTG